MKLLSVCLSLLGLTCAQNASLAQDNTIATQGLVGNSSRFDTILRVDNGTYGNPVEEVHYFYNYWPIGLAVSSTSRIFACYTRGMYDCKCVPFRVIPRILSVIEDTAIPQGLFRRYTGLLYYTLSASNRRMTQDCTHSLR